MTAAASDRPVPLALPTPLLMVITVTCQAAVALYLPSMPSMPASLGASTALVQATLSAYLVAFAVAQLFAGPLSDRLGRRRVILGGIALFVVASALCALAPSAEWLVVARVLQGAGACCGIILARAIVRDLATGPVAARAIAMLATAMALARGDWRLLGGQLHTWFGWRGGFAAIAVVAVAVLAAAWRKLPETIDPARPRTGFLDGYGELLRQRRFMGFAGGITCGTGAFYCFIGAGPRVFIDVLHVPLEMFGFITMMWAGAFVIGAQIIARWNVALGPRRMVFVGAVTSLVAALAMAGLAVTPAAGLVSVALPLFFIGLGNGLNLPNGSASALAASPPRIAGTASAIVGFMQMGLGAAITWCIGLLPHDSAAPMALAVAGFSAVGICCYWLAVRGAR